MKLEKKDHAFHKNIKGIVHPKMKILSLITPLYIVPNQSMWAELSGENFRSPLTWVFAPPLHRSKSDQIAPLNSAPRSSTISSRSGEIAPRSLKFKITLHA